MLETGEKLTSPPARHYAHPPVVEALAEVYFVGSVWDATVPGRFYDRICDRFPDISSQVELQVGGPNPTDPPETRERVQFRSPGADRIVQVAKDLLVVNRLRPYSSFEDWIGDTSEMLAVYRELARPTGFSRVGVRYINRIPVESEGIELSRYFRIYPEVPDELGSPFGPFLLRVETTPPGRPAHRMVTTFGTSETDEHEPALLLDLYDIVSAQDNPGLERLMGLISEGHENVVVAFENAITDAVRARFGQEGAG